MRRFVFISSIFSVKEESKSPILREKGKGEEKEKIV